MHVGEHEAHREDLLQEIVELSRLVDPLPERRLRSRLADGHRRKPGPQVVGRPTRQVDVVQGLLVRLGPNNVHHGLTVLALFPRRVTLHG